MICPTLFENNKLSCGIKNYGYYIFYLEYFITHNISGYRGTITGLFVRNFLSHVHRKALGVICSPEIFCNNRKSNSGQ
jgi:hypothetical protein